MTEYQKMVSGLPFDPTHPELRALREQARLSCAKYNQHPSKGNHRHIVRLIDGLNSNYFEPGIQIDYGVNISIGENFYANFNCVFLDSGPINIGNNVKLGPAAHIYTVDHPRDSLSRREPICTAKPVSIEDDVWIGGGAKILPGVRIGSGAIIGSNTVIKNDVPSQSIIQGSK